MIEPEDYVRIPFPATRLRSANGETLDLADLVRDRACLLVLIPEASAARAATLAAVENWKSRLTRVTVRPVFAGAAPIALPPGTGQDSLYSAAELSAALRIEHLPAAALLGMDGLLAGGPVSGLEEMELFVTDIVAQLGETANGRDATPLPISCKCITYGRVSLLEESLASFLAQDYAGESELVIVNDYPAQRLHFDHPRVRIYNLDFTFPSIGAKENFAVSACRYDTVAVWDDDDIALPWHLQNINRHFRGHDLLHWQRGAYLEVGELKALNSLGNSGIVYSRPLWLAVGGLPSENAGYDVTFVNRLREAGAHVALAEPPPPEVSWFYRWRGGSYHMSGMGTDDGTRPNILARHAAHIEGLRRTGEIPTGDIQLLPQWRRDYTQMLEEYLNSDEQSI